MKSEKASVHNANLIFRIVLGYCTLRRSEMVYSINTITPDASYMGAEPRNMRKLRLAGILELSRHSMLALMSNSNVHSCTYHTNGCSSN